MDAIVGVALGEDGAFDKDKKTDKVAVCGTAIGASIGSGGRLGCGFLEWVFIVLIVLWVIGNTFG